MSFLEPKKEELSEMQIKVLSMAAEGLTNRQIVQRTRRTEDGVATSMRLILVKLGAINRCHAVALAIRRGII